MQTNGTDLASWKPQHYCPSQRAETSSGEGMIRLGHLAAMQGERETKTKRQTEGAEGKEWVESVRRRKTNGTRASVLKASEGSIGRHDNQPGLRLAIPDTGQARVLHLDADKRGKGNKEETTNQKQQVLDDRGRKK